MIADEVVPPQLFILYRHIREDDRDAGVEVGSLVVAGVHEQDRVAVLGKLGGNWSTTGTRTNYNVVIGGILCLVGGGNCRDHRKKQGEKRRSGKSSHGDVLTARSLWVRLSPIQSSRMLMFISTL